MPGSIKTYVDDTNSTIGHRDAMLDLETSSVSFGYAEKYNCIINFADNKETLGNTDDFYSWPPAGYMAGDEVPTHKFWSIEVNKLSDYIWSKADLKLKLTCNGKTYTIDNNKLYKDPYSSRIFMFKLPNELQNDVIDEMYGFKKNTKISVDFSGFSDKYGNSHRIKYDVTFFYLHEIKADSADVYIGTNRDNLGYVTIKEDKEDDITVYLRPLSAYNKEYTLEIQDKTIAKLNKAQTKITGLKEGTTQIIVRRKTDNEIVERKKLNVTYTLPFKDVPKNSWYYNAAKYTYKNNIIKGTSNTTFSPNAKLTRGMFVTILYRMEGEPKISGTPKFLDVKNSKDWFYNAILWASQNNIVSGYLNGKFGPNDNITREQLAVILNKYAKYKKKNTSATNNLSNFRDKNKVSSWALEQMKWAVGAGVITGNGDGTLNPKGYATRAEAVAMIEKYCNKVGR